MYEDFNGQGTDYRLAGFRNMQTEQNIRVIDIQDEIIPENRVCTLEQTEVYVKAVESFMEEMQPEESTKGNRPVYERYDQEYEKGR